VLTEHRRRDQRGDEWEDVVEVPADRRRRMHD
jgi:hypothetical protein